MPLGGSHYPKTMAGASVDSSTQVERPCCNEKVMTIVEHSLNHLNERLADKQAEVDTLHRKVAEMEARERANEFVGPQILGLTKDVCDRYREVKEELSKSQKALADANARIREVDLGLTKDVCDRYREVKEELSKSEKARADANARIREVEEASSIFAILGKRMRDELECGCARRTISRTSWPTERVATTSV
eukprot:tig00020921_g15926.t1